MSTVIGWIAAEAGRPKAEAGERPRWLGAAVPIRDLRAHQFPASSPLLAKSARSGAPVSGGMFRDREMERRTYRGRTVAMLRRYMRYSIETGRLPSLLGREFFRTNVTSYNVVTFEDRVIFVHDMESCLDRLDEFSRELIARHILQEHDQEATARLLQCNERTVRRWAPLALDQLSEILLEMGLLERIEGNEENSCQVGESSRMAVNRCADDGNKRNYHLHKAGGNGPPCYYVSLYISIISDF